MEAGEPTKETFTKMVRLLEKRNRLGKPKWLDQGNQLKGLCRALPIRD